MADTYTIQFRRGMYADFDTSKIRPGEPVAILGNDPSVPSGKALYIAFAANDVRRLCSIEDILEMVNAGEFVGPQGPKGEKGDKGADGTVAFESLTPEQKESLRGISIKSASVDTDGNLTITFSDGDSEDVGNIMGPQGIQGPKGDKGDVGPQGLKGDKGDVGPKGDNMSDKQAQQIEQNKTDIALLKKETGSLKEDLSTKITKFYASSQGETHLADSDNGKIMDMVLYGRSEQKQYSGKNLFDFHQLKPKAPNITTVTTTEDAIIVSSNAQTFTGAFKVYKECDAFKGKTITISANIVKADNFDAVINFGCGLFYENQWHWKLQKVTDLGARYITVIVPETITKIQFLLNTNDNNVAKANTITVSKYMVEYGSEPTTYEPYTGGIPSPNPDYPQEIKSVVNPTVKVCGKNLLKGKSEIKNKNVTFDVDKVIVNGEISSLYGDVFGRVFLKAGTYTVSTTFNSIQRIELRYGSQSAWVIDGKASTITLSEDIDVEVTVIIKIGTYSNVTDYIQIEKGSTPTTYEPYHEQTVILPYTLNAIPVSSGGNVTIDGQQYIADYVDVERGKLVRMVGEFDTKDLTVFGGDETDGVYRGYFSDSMLRNFVAGNSFRTKLFDGESTPNAIRQYSVYMDKNNKGQWLNFICDSTYRETADLKSFIQNTGTVYGIFETPTEIDLATEEITAFKALATYYPTTNISINSEQLDGYTVFNYPISMVNGWNYVKQQIGDTRDYIYDMDARAQDTDLQAAEAYVNSEYAVTLTELEV